MLLCRFLGNGFRLALCNVGWLTTQKFVILVPDPIFFAPWSVLLDCTASFVRTPTTTQSSCGATTMAAASEVCFVVISQDTSLETVL